MMGSNLAATATPRQTRFLEGVWRIGKKTHRKLQIGQELEALACCFYCLVGLLQCMYGVRHRGDRRNLLYTACAGSDVYDRGRPRVFGKTFILCY